MSTPLKVLLVEDNPNDAQLVVRELRRAGFDPDFRRVETEAAYIAALNPDLDAVLSDFELPQFSGAHALAILQERDIGVPFIVISGAIGEETAAWMINLGASDYLLKDRLTRLGPALERALEQARRAKQMAKDQRDIRERDERFSKLTQYLPMLLWSANDQGQCNYVSPAFQSIWGREPTVKDGVIDWFESVHEDDRGVIADALAAASVQDGFDIEYRVVRPDKTVRHVHTMGYAVRQASQAAIHLVGYTEDVTARKARDEERHRSRALQDLGRFASNVQQSFGELTQEARRGAALLEDDTLSPEVRDFIARVVSAEDRSQRATEQLLAVSGARKMERRRLVLSDVLQQSQPALGQLLGDRIKLSVSMSEERLRIHGDLGMLEELLRELALQARQSMQGEGVLRMSVSARSLADGASSAPQAVHLTVLGRGVAAADDEAERLFESSATMRPPSKAGLGLLAIQGIVRQHRGTLRTVADNDGMTGFEIAFPSVGAPDVQAQPQEVDQVAVRTLKQRVLAG